MTFFFHNRALLSALKSCSGTSHFSSLVFLTTSGNLSAALVGKSCSPVILTFLKLKVFLKLSNYHLLALNTTALHPLPSFCFNLSYNNFAFSQVIESIGIPFLIALLPSHKNCIFFFIYLSIITLFFLVLYYSCPNAFSI